MLTTILKLCFIIIFLCIIYKIYINKKGDKDVDKYVDKYEHFYFEEEENEDYSYRRVIHYQGKYKEPQYYDSESNYYNILTTNNKPMYKTNDKLINWGNLENNLVEKQKLFDLDNRLYDNDNDNNDNDNNDNNDNLKDNYMNACWNQLIN
jgi:hypothetical protein